MKQYKKNAKKGFTLLEGIIAVTLLSLISIGFFTIINAVSGTSLRADVYNDMTSDYVERYNSGQSTDDHDGENTYTTKDGGEAGYVVGTGKSGNDVTLNFKVKEITTGDGFTTEEVRGTKYSAGIFRYYY